MAHVYRFKQYNIQYNSKDQATNSANIGLSLNKAVATD